MTLMLLVEIYVCRELKIHARSYLRGCWQLQYASQPLWFNCRLIEGVLILLYYQEITVLFSIYIFYSGKRA